MVLDVPLQETGAGEPPVPRLEVFGEEMVFPGGFGRHCFLVCVSNLGFLSSRRGRRCVC